MQAVEGRCAWIDLAWGVAYDSKKLGPPNRGPPSRSRGTVRLGPSVGRWQDDGCHLPGFLPKPTSVMVMLSGKCSKRSLSLSSLASLFDLPRGSFDRFTIRSLISEGPAQRLSDRGGAVLETRSPRALQLTERLTSHLVGESKLLISDVTAGDHAPLHVLVGEECISRFATAESNDPSSLTLVDWES